MRVEDGEKSKVSYFHFILFIFFYYYYFFFALLRSGDRPFLTLTVPSCNVFTECAAIL